ncbi:TPA: BppU family phage baseplate upper protein [Bacillus paranthracis]|nr:BppU family phage baseplate upper protein [Bacillus cereus]
MNNQSYEITVDTRKSISHSNIEFSQNNLNISELIFNITEDGTNFTLNDTDKIIVYFEKPDKTVVFQDKEVELLDKEKGKIKVLLTSQTLVKAGDVKGQISIERIEDGTRKRVNTYDFSFKVRSSIASNDSIESTNEFQIFDKIMVAGEKFKDFEDEDFDELIAAGELAKGALPKSGGTMTGNIDLDTSVGSKSKGYRWRDASGTIYGLETSTTGELILYDYKAAARIWQYDPVSKRFTVLSDTNLLKTTGGTVTGDVNFDPDKGVSFNSGGTTKNNYLLKGQGTQNKIALQDKTSGKWIWEYNSDTSTFSVLSESNLVKKAGDSFTGTTSVNNDVFFAFNDASGTGSRAFKLYPDGKFSLRDLQNGKDIFDVTNGKFNVNVDTNLVSKTKDGRVNPVLTADAVMGDATNPPSVIRRGNTVTLRMKVSLKAGAAGTRVTSLPDVFRPIEYTEVNVQADDGSIVKLTVGTGGGVDLYTKGKIVTFVLTYVVD